LIDAISVTAFLRIQVPLEMGVKFRDELHRLSRIRALFYDSDWHWFTRLPSDVRCVETVARLMSSISSSLLLLLFPSFPLP
jgi:hypothetical protein